MTINPNRLGIALLLATVALPFGLPGNARALERDAVASAPSSLSADATRELADLLTDQASWKSIDLMRHRLPRVPADAFDRLKMWNEIALDTTALDHTPLVANDIRPRFGEQFGPHRASRAMAIAHIALFEAVNAIAPRFESYTGLRRVHGRAVAMDRAIARAGYDTLSALYPAQKARLDALFAQDIATISADAGAQAAGDALGKAAAASILRMRDHDGSEVPEISVGTGAGDFHVTNAPGFWSPDPVSGLTLTLGAHWGAVKPFTLRRGNQFRPAPPPAIGSAEYVASYDSVFQLGGDPAAGTPTTRTDRQSYIGRFWGYDSTPALCAPPRLYNMVATTIALQQGMHNVTEFARYLALINTAMADAGISAWESKWYYQEWRPVTGIRNAPDGGTPNWTPSGAPATNTAGPNFTPPFPAYPSGHATFGGALFEVIRAYWPDNTSFTIVSDEFNGQNRDADGTIRPLLPETFASFSEAERDNAESRIYNGVHWEFDATAGIDEGHKVAHWVLAHAFRRLDADDRE